MTFCLRLIIKTVDIYINPKNEDMGVLCHALLVTACLILHCLPGCRFMSLPHKWLMQHKASEHKRKNISKECQF